MMTESPMDPAAPASPEAGPDAGPDAVELLVRAVGHLDPADRDRVFAWLLRRDAGQLALAGPVLTAPEGTVRRSRWALNPDLPNAQLDALVQQSLVHGVRGTPGGQQMVPVRFSTDQHAQLREWCAEHGFSMATVIRGLVARFLEGQIPGSTGASPA
jgi:hypothetical protein